MLNGALEENPKFTGQTHDIDTDLYYYNARYYDPTLGRFLQADSLIANVFQPQTINPYAYVLNNPLKYTDPTGHEPFGGDENLNLNGNSSENEREITVVISQGVDGVARDVTIIGGDVNNPKVKEALRENGLDPDNLPSSDGDASLDSGGESSGGSSPSINAPISSPTGTSNTAAAGGTVSVNSGGAATVGLGGVVAGSPSASPSDYIGLAAKAAAVFESMVFKTGMGNIVARSAGNALGIFADITHVGGPGELIGAKIGGTIVGATGAGIGFKLSGPRGAVIGASIGNTIGGIIGGAVGKLFDKPTDGSAY